jgi:DNA-binding CsgD family transcriptional regulator
MPSTVAPPTASPRRPSSPSTRCSARAPRRCTPTSARSSGIPPRRRTSSRWRSSAPTGGAGGSTRGAGTQRAWLFAIARNAALDELRRRRRSAALLADPEDPQAAAPADLGEDADRRATVRAALAGLEPRDRELVALKFWGGLSNTEIAAVLGVSESNAGTRVHRAVTKLREACA